MPSSHSQFLGFFCSFFLAHFYLHHPKAARPRTLVNTMRRIEHWFAMLAIVGLTGLTCYSRWHLSYHSGLQVGIGLGIGLIVGAGYYYLTEYLPRQPIRLPAPLGSPASSPKARRATARDAGSNSGIRRRKNSSSSPSPPSSGRKRHRRRSSLAASLMPELHPSPPLRQLILDHPFAVAFRLRDSWTVWLDGGIEGEYEAWRQEWERRRRPAGGTPVGSRDEPLAAGGLIETNEKASLAAPAAAAALASITGSSSSSSSTTSSEPHLSHIIHTLRLASLCPPTKTAFCVGCVIASPHTGRILATGYSRETGEERNEHAEQVALGKLAESTGEAGEGEGIVELDLYTSMEPCSERLSGALPCVQRILAFNDEQKGAPRLRPMRITRVFQALQEPDDFIATNVSAGLLRDNNIKLTTVLPPAGERKGDGSWIEREALRLAKHGHPDQPVEREGDSDGWRKAQGGR